jgi:hypothetical protein
MKNSILILMVLLAIAMNFSPAKSQSIVPIQADTVFKGYTSGETSSVKIINHGTSIIYNHSGKLYEMSATKYKPIREIMLDGIDPVTKYDVDDNCRYIFYNTGKDTITYVADFYTGKTIKTFHGRFFLTKDYLFLRTQQQGSWSGVNSKYDILSIEDFGKIESFYISREGTDSDYLGVGSFVCIYDKNYLIFEIPHSNFRTGGNRTGTEWVAIDSATHSLKSTPFSTQGKLIASKTGRTFAYCASGSINIYNESFKIIANINEDNLKKYYNDGDVRLLSDMNIIDDKYLISSIKYNNGTKIVQNVQVYDILEKKAVKFIDFENYTSACYNNKFIFSNKQGCLATLTLEQLPVLEKKEPTDNYFVQYSNNNLVIQAEESKGVDISIMNLTGERVESLNNFYLNEGSNTIELNTHLASGLYFYIIQTSENTFSRKFMVIE